jgi:hypothetical protein
LVAYLASTLFYSAFLKQALFLLGDDGLCKLRGQSPVLRNDPRDGGLANVVEARHICTGFSAGDNALCYFATLCSIEFLSPAADAALGPCDGDAG